MCWEGHDWLIAPVVFLYLLLMQSIEKGVVGPGPLHLHCAVECRWIPQTRDVRVRMGAVREFSDHASAGDLGGPVNNLSWVLAYSVVAAGAVTGLFRVGRWIPCPDDGR